IALMVVFTLLLLLLFKAMGLGRLLGWLLCWSGLWWPVVATTEELPADDDNNRLTSGGQRAAIKQGSSSDEFVVCRHCNGSGKLPRLRCSSSSNVTKVYYVATRAKGPR